MSEYDISKIQLSNGDICNLRDSRLDILGTTDARIIQSIVRSGLADQFFKIGDQIVVNWALDDNTVYEMPWDVVDIASVIDQEGNSVPGLWLQSHWALPGIQFDGNEAFYHCDETLSTGTYNITMGNNWGTNIVKDKVYQFTLSENVPSGGQLVLTTNSSTTGENDPSKWYVRSYASSTSITEIEKVAITEGSQGTSLGTLSSSTKFGSAGLNNMQRSCYGYNRWSQSGIRQWLNSDKNTNLWWEAKNVYDRPPDQLTSLRGFMAGLPEDFLNIINPVKVTTALNTVSDTNIGTSENTYDMFFLASLEQEYCNPQLANTEGKYWPYWKERLAINSPQSSGSPNALANHIHYGIDNHTLAQNCRLRSAYRSYALYTWIVSTSGSVSYGNTTNAYRTCPACVIH